MQLEQWRKLNRITYRELAEKLGVAFGTAYNMCHGVGCITLRNAHKVVTLTDGQCNYMDLLTELEEC